MTTQGTAAREADALGPRMTGAGFSGCTVNFVPEANLDCFFAGVEKTYYRDFLGMSELPPGAIIVAEAALEAGLL
jgi:galactokinase